MFYHGSGFSDGSGIGLYIVPKAADKINGTIIIETSPAQGTTINFWLPSLKIVVVDK